VLSISQRPNLRHCVSR